MSQLQKNRRSSSAAVVCSIALVFAWTCFADAQNSADRIRLAKDVVRQLFPELRGRGLRVSIVDATTLDGGMGFLSFDLDVSEPRDHLSPSEKCDVPLLLSAGFQFATSSRAQRFFALNLGGPATNTDKREHLNQAVDSHPEWSTGQIEEALSSAGARFGPSSKDDFVKTVPLSTLKLLLQAEVQMVSANFEFRDAAQLREHLPSSILLWHVAFSVRSSAQGKLNYAGLFEPFSGKLVSLSKVPAIP